MNRGQKALKKAKKIIQEEINYYQKEAKCFCLAIGRPYYKKKAKVWDLNNKVYYDFAGMGVTACVLGIFK